MTFELMIEKVRYEGAHSTRQQAEEVVHAVLAAFGRQLTGDERAELMACLPPPAAAILTSEGPSTEPLTCWSFLKDLASRTGGTAATTRWNAGTVLRVVSHLAGEELTHRIISQLPPGYALLFGRTHVAAA